MCLSEVETTFFPLHAGNGRESLRHSPATFPQSRECACCRIRPGENSGDLLCCGLDPAFKGSADHSCGCDLTVAPCKYWPARRWNSRVARPRVDPGLHRHSDALRHSPRLPGNASQRRRNASAISREPHKKDGPLGGLPKIPREHAQGVLRETCNRRKRFWLLLASQTHRQPFLFRVPLRHTGRKNGGHVFDGTESSR